MLQATDIILFCTINFKRTRCPKPVTSSFPVPLVSSVQNAPSHLYEATQNDQFRDTQRHALIMVSFYHLSWVRSLMLHRFRWLLWPFLILDFLFLILKRLQARCSWMLQVTLVTLFVFWFFDSHGTAGSMLQRFRWLSWLCLPCDFWFSRDCRLDAFGCFRLLCGPCLSFWMSGGRMLFAWELSYTILWSNFMMQKSADVSRWWYHSVEVVQDFFIKVLTRKQKTFQGNDSVEQDRPLWNFHTAKEACKQGILWQPQQFPAHIWCH